MGFLNTHMPLSLSLYVQLVSLYTEYRPQHLVLISASWRNSKCLGQLIRRTNLTFIGQHRLSNFVFPSPTTQVVHILRAVYAFFYMLSFICFYLCIIFMVASSISFFFFLLWAKSHYASLLLLFALTKQILWPLSKLVKNCAQCYSLAKSLPPEMNAINVSY